MNSSELRVNIDKVLGNKLGVMYVNVPDFYKALFGNILNFAMVSAEIF